MTDKGYSYNYQTLLVGFDEGVCVLTLNRPDKRNAMNPTLGEEITDALERLRNDDRCRVLVITGAGDSFCAGMDLKEFFMELQDKPAEYDRAHRVAVEWRGRTLRLFTKPTIAMVNGHCFGGAFTIVEGCDLAVAAEDAKMGLSEINFKMFPGGSVGKSMGNLLRPRDYMLYALTGRPMSGQIAADIGFINYAVPRAELRDDGQVRPCLDFTTFDDFVKPRRPRVGGGIDDMDVGRAHARHQQIAAAHRTVIET